jgi:diguanylate cyclase (GGDEF)-like protein
MNKSRLRALQGALLSLGAPLGWLIIQCFSGFGIVAELSNNLALYSYMLLATMGVFILFGRYVGHKEDLILKLSFIDSLTGIYNLRFYLERMQQEISYSHRTKTPLSLIYFDLDHFKNINDSYGHPFGDEVLKRVCATIKNDIRAHDIFARIGGEEFSILLPNCPLSEAKINAERIRKSVEQYQFLNHEQEQVKVTISLGVAALREEEDYESFYKRADKHLYLAKNQGRNRVFV